MCLAKAYLGESEAGELILEDVALLRVEEGKLLLRSLFGEQKEVDCTIKTIDFQKSSIILESKA